MKKLLLTFLAGFFLIGTISAGAAEPGDELPAKVIAAESWEPTPGTRRRRADVWNSCNKERNWILVLVNFGIARIIKKETHPKAGTVQLQTETIYT
ncbi:hypothetical protein P7H22_13665 [Paenibacillus larvae]|nr:hypothetical protein [Paenibacillus larvae]MDT2241191.1 hypothetical protein [Paenibacillus larvae]